MPLSATKLVREMLFVPPSMPVLDLLAKMQATRIHLALVVDEYGGTDGAASMEDIVEIVHHQVPKISCQCVRYVWSHCVLEILALWAGMENTIEAIFLMIFQPRRQTEASEGEDNRTLQDSLPYRL